jgi:uncharacterized protein YkwD
MTETCIVMIATAPHQTFLRRLSIAAVLCVLTAATVMLSASGARAAEMHRPCVHARTTILHADQSQLQRAVVCLINRRRTAHHLPVLTASRKLDHSAQRWTDAMVSDEQFSHGTAFMDRISEVGFDWTDAGENIATGFTTPESVVNAWMASPGHCANILDPLYREVGTGVVNRLIHGHSNIDGTWTQDFGRLMSQRPLSQNFGPARACYSH